MYIHMTGGAGYPISALASYLKPQGPQMPGRALISRAPYRVSFFGGGSDYPSWFLRHGGMVLSTAIDRFCYVSLRKLPPFFEHKSRIVHSRIELVKENSEISHPLIRNCLKFHRIEEGVEIHFDGDMPGRSGIGSSSAFAVALLAALRAYDAGAIERRALAEDAILVERSMCRENVGIQDQISAAFGGFNFIRIDRYGLFRVEPVMLSRAYLKRFESHFLLGFTGTQRDSSDVAGATMRAIDAGVADQFLAEMVALAQEGYAILKKEGSLQEFGLLLHRSWMCKRQLCDRISNSQIDSIYERALRAGAWGGKLSGAGAGGFVLLMAPPGRHAAIKNALPDIRAWIAVRSEPRGAEILAGSKADRMRKGRNSFAWR